MVLDVFGGGLRGHFSVFLGLSRSFSVFPKGLSEGACQPLSPPRGSSVIDATTPPRWTTMNPANNATMFKPFNSTNAAANRPQTITIFATSARIQTPSAPPPFAPETDRSTLCAKYAVGTRLLIPPNQRRQRRGAAKRHRGGGNRRRQQTLNPEDPADQRTDRSTVCTQQTASKQAGLTAGPARRTPHVHTPLSHSPVANARLYGARSHAINASEQKSVVRTNVLSASE